MSANSPHVSPPRLADLPAEESAWHQLELIIDELGQATSSGLVPETFYERLVARAVQSLAAIGGAAWVREPGGALRIVAQVGQPLEAMRTGPEARRHHESRLSQLASDSPEVATSCEPAPAIDRAALPSQLLIASVPAIATGPLNLPQPPSRPAAAIVEIAQHADASPAVYQGQLRFLAALCEVASEYHAYRELGQLRSFHQYHRQLFDLSRRVHRAIGLRPTAYELANEGARVIGCDRLGVATIRGRRCQLIAASGVGRLQRRSGTVRQLEKLAAIAARFREPIYYSGDTSDCLPQVAEMLEEYADQSHVRQLVMMPLSLPTQDENQAGRGGSASDDTDPVAVLIAEQFDAEAGELLKERVSEVAMITATALVQASRWDRLPLRWLLQQVGRFRDLLLPRAFLKTTFVVVVLTAIAAALVFVPADFTVTAPGKLQPSVRRHVFASRSGLVDEVLVQHGDAVDAGDELVRLRDSELDLHWKRIVGEMATATEQLDSVRATKSVRDVGELTATEVYRLSAEERQLEQQLENLRRELELLDAERTSLVIRSPLAGNVITWDVHRLLAARPVDRGQVLLTVADLSDNWQLELEVADDHIGHVLSEGKDSQAPLPVSFRLNSNEYEQFEGSVQRIAALAEIEPSDTPASSPAVRVVVQFDNQPLTKATGGEMRPGMSARAEIHCGQRSLGYVWLHDVWDAARRRLTF